MDEGRRRSRSTLHTLHGGRAIVSRARGSKARLVHLGRRRLERGHICEAPGRVILASGARGVCDRGARADRRRVDGDRVPRQRPHATVVSKGLSSYC
jgi:hypothetical protein